MKAYVAIFVGAKRLLNLPNSCNHSLYTHCFGVKGHDCRYLGGLFYCYSYWGVLGRAQEAALALVQIPDAPVEADEDVVWM